MAYLGREVGSQAWSLEVSKKTVKFQDHEQAYIVEILGQNKYQGWTSSNSPYPPNRAEAEGERPAQNWRPERRPERLVVGWLDRKTERHTQGGVCELSHWGLRLPTPHSPPSSTHPTELRLRGWGRPKTGGQRDLSLVFRKIWGRSLDHSGVLKVRKAQTIGLDIQVYFVFVYLHLAWTRKKISLFLYLRFPMTIAIFLSFILLR